MAGGDPGLGGSCGGGWRGAGALRPPPPTMRRAPSRNPGGKGAGSGEPGGLVCGGGREVGLSRRGV